MTIMNMVGGGAPNTGDVIFKSFPITNTSEFLVVKAVGSNSRRTGVDKPSSINKRRCTNDESVLELVSAGELIRTGEIQGFGSTNVTVYNISYRWNKQPVFSFEFSEDFVEWVSNNIVNMTAQMTCDLSLDYLIAESSSEIVNIEIPFNVRAGEIQMSNYNFGGWAYSNSTHDNYSSGDILGYVIIRSIDVNTVSLK